MTAPHIMPWHWGDYWRDTGHLSTLEHGAYLRLLGYAWVHNGKIPKNEKQLLAITQLHHKQWTTSKNTLLEMFVEADRFWTHKRVCKELAKSLEYQEAQRAAARARHELASAYLNKKDNTSSSRGERDRAAERRKRAAEVRAELTAVGIETPDDQTPVSMELRARLNGKGRQP